MELLFPPQGTCGRQHGEEDVLSLDTRDPLSASCCSDSAGQRPARRPLPEGTVGMRVCKGVCLAWPIAPS